MTRYALYTSYPKAWAAMLEQIRRARVSIFIEMYIMVDDTRGFEFIAALEEKAKEGVSVKLVLDSFGSFALSDSAIQKLEKGGVEVLFFSHWFRRLHRKLLIVDERVLITGGVNIHETARGWTDLAVKITGRKAVRVALRAFSKTYVRAGGVDPIVLRYRNGAVARKIKALFQNYGVNEKNMTLKRYYRSQLASAQKTVQLVTPYLVPDRWLVAALDQAALRGVIVEIIVPAEGDSWFMDRANRYSIRTIAKTNVHVYLFPTMNHAKVLLVDGREALVGSQNLDSLSFNVNSESAVRLTERGVVDDVSSILARWKAASERYSLEELPTRWYDHFLALFVRVFQPLL